MVASCCYHVRAIMWAWSKIRARFARDYLSEHHCIGDPGSAICAFHKQSPLDTDGSPTLNIRQCMDNAAASTPTTSSPILAL